MKTVEERICEVICAAVIIFAVFYFGGHIIAAWLHGAFQVVSR